LSLLLHISNSPCFLAHTMSPFKLSVIFSSLQDLSSAYAYVVSTFYCFLIYWGIVCWFWFQLGWIFIIFLSQIVWWKNTIVHCSNELYTQIGGLHCCLFSVYLVSYFCRILATLEFSFLFPILFELVLFVVPFFGFKGLVVLCNFVCSQQEKKYELRYRSLNWWMSVYQIYLLLNLNFFLVSVLLNV
jgi:hypothetical protein